MEFNPQLKYGVAGILVGLVLGGFLFYTTPTVQTVEKQVEVEKIVTVTVEKIVEKKVYITADKMTKTTQTNKDGTLLIQETYYNLGLSETSQTKDKIDLNISSSVKAKESTKITIKEPTFSIGLMYLTSYNNILNFDYKNISVLAEYKVKNTPFTVSALFGYNYIGLGLTLQF